MGRLIINADDFGLTYSVNRAIAELHREGLLTSTTMMAHAEGSENAIELALEHPGLGVGCHVVLLNGSPVLPGDRIPSLIDRSSGNFYSKLGGFLPRLLAGSISAAEIEAEAAAQIGRLQSRGLRLTHIDTHKHVHSFPQVLRPVLRAAKAAGIRAVRNPFEPGWAIAAAEHVSPVRRLMVRSQGMLRGAFLRIVAEEGFFTTDGAIGVAATGTMNADTLKKLLDRLPTGTWELVTHPGYNDAALARAHTVLLDQREVEKKALAEIASHPEHTLLSFSSLAAPADGTRPELETTR